MYYSKMDKVIMMIIIIINAYKPRVVLQILQVGRRNVVIYSANGDEQDTATAAMRLSHSVKIGLNPKVRF